MGCVVNTPHVVSICIGNNQQLIFPPGKTGNTVTNFPPREHREINFYPREHRETPGFGNGSRFGFKKRPGRSHGLTGLWPVGPVLRSAVGSSSDAISHLILII
jgi:hypothetical protein